MANYGAGKTDSQSFDPNKNYIGLIIMAVRSNQQWFTDNSNDFT